MNYLYWALACMFALQTQCIEQEKQMPTFWQNVINGAAAGSAEVLCNNPLIVLKNQLILRTKKEAAAVRQRQPITGTFLLNLVRRYYKGAGTGVAAMAPITAFQNSTALALASLYGQNPTLAEKTVASLLAGALSAVLGSPADMVVLQRSDEKNAHESFRQTLQRLLALNGTRTLYRGVSGTAARDALFTTAYKTGGALIDPYIPIKTGNKKADGIVSNVVAALFATVMSHPADVVTARMKGDSTSSLYKNSLQTALKIASEEGYSAFFKGIVPRGIRIALAIPLLNALTEAQIGMKAVNHITQAK